MPETLEFPVLLQLIDERSKAFRAAVAAAPDLDAQVPTCPEWTLRNLAQHLGNVHRFWAATVKAGQADAPPEGLPENRPEEREELLAWSQESARELLDALREAGQDRGCWTWWPDSASPQTAGAVARHQVQEAMVHTYDAQITAGKPEPLPEQAALDGVDEFLATCCVGDKWPHEPAVVDYHAAEGGSWRLVLSSEPSRLVRLPEPATSAEAPDASARATAADLVLTFYGRLPIDTPAIEGDRTIFERLRDWNPEE